jgi:hypothetical protein
MRRLIVCACTLALMATACGDGTTGKNNGNNQNNTTGMNNTTGNNGDTTGNNGDTSGNNGDTSGNNGDTSGQNNTTGNNNTTNSNTNTGTNNTNNTTNNNTNNMNGGDAAEVSDAFWNAVCEAMFQCENRDTAFLTTILGGRFDDEADCKASAYRGSDLDYSQFQLGIDEGRLTYDGTNTDACADAFKDSLCDPADDGSDLATACEGIWTGNVDEGDNCALNEECMSGNCEEIDDECYGTCEQAPDPSECGAENCLDTQYCGEEGGTPTCLAKKDDGDDCDTDEECMEGSGCRQRQVGGGVCTELASLSENDICNGETRFCETGLVCVGQQISRCTTLEFSGDGETCSFGGATSCSAGLACQDIGFDGNGTCEAPRAMGDECQFSFQCHNDLFCDGATFGTPGECAERLDNGATCGQDGNCDSENCVFADPNDETGTCEAPELCMLP